MLDSFNRTVAVLFTLPLLIMACKTVQMGGDLRPLLPEKSYRVTYEFTYSHPDKPVFVKAYIPQNTEHQRIEVTSDPIPGMKMRVRKQTDGHRARWETLPEDVLTAYPPERIRYSFLYTGKEMEYLLEDDLPLEQAIPDSLAEYLQASKHIQSEDPLIDRVAERVVRNGGDLKTVLRRIYAYTYKIPRIKSAELMDAKTCLVGREASCNGRSRLFVAMARARGIPARLVGGMILKQGSKRTSHQWVEAYVHGTWIPFDALNGHFARLPAHYMELYRGDEFLITHSPRIDFDYMFHIQPKLLSSYQSPGKSIQEKRSSLDFVMGKFVQAGFPLGFLKILLLLPVLGLTVTLCKNVVGLKTIGTFLPAILGISLDYSGLGYGGLLLAATMLWVVLMHKALEKWGMLQGPKLVMLLTGVVLIILVISFISLTYGRGLNTAMGFFPVIILTFLAERFARKMDEEGPQEAGKLLGQTLIVALACYRVFASALLESLLFVFPELLLAVMGATLLLGKWIGLRVIEYIRFGQLADVQHQLKSYWVS